MTDTFTIEPTVERLLFGVESQTRADTVLQNHLTLFEWATRNKRYPAFWGRYLTGENRLTRREIDFLHVHGCKIAALCSEYGEKETEEQGYAYAKKISNLAYELGIPEKSAIFTELEQNQIASTAYMRGYANGLLQDKYIPGYKANTDAEYPFDREFSRGMQIDREIFSKCLVGATAPTLAEYDRITTTHLIQPANWAPYAPSGIRRNTVAVWQYGKDCHPIDDHDDHETVFHVNLVRNKQVIDNQMF